MEVKMTGNFKVIIPQTQMCHVFLNDIFQKEYHRQKSQANKQLCSVLQNQ